MYAVKELFYTLQGEGAQSGRAAVFCRFAGCNLWSGREQDRTSAVCRFCDTDFVGTDGLGGGMFGSPSELIEAIVNVWSGNANEGRPYIVCTGGEPLLQIDDELIAAAHSRGYEVAIETNGTIPIPDRIDWVCVSPKAGAPLVVRSGDELKLVYPQHEFPPSDIADLNFTHFYLQPMDGPDRIANTIAAAEYCLLHPRWKLSLQTHKIIGLP